MHSATAWSALAALCFSAAVFAQKDAAGDFLIQAQELMRAGKPEDAVTLYRAAAQAMPNLTAPTAGREWRWI